MTERILLAVDTSIFDVLSKIHLGRIFDDSVSHYNFFSRERRKISGSEDSMNSTNVY